MAGVVVSERTVEEEEEEEVVGVEEKRRRRAAVKVEVADNDDDDDGAAIDDDGDDDPIDLLAAKLPTFGAGDARALVRRARDRTDAAIARAPEAAEGGDIAGEKRLVDPVKHGTAMSRERKKKVRQVFSLSLSRFLKTFFFAFFGRNRPPPPPGWKGKAGLEK